MMITPLFGVVNKFKKSVVPKYFFVGDNFSAFVVFTN